MPPRSGSTFSRRTLLAWIGATAGLMWRGDAFALEPEVPVRLQIDLLNRVIPYDRNFASRVHGELVVAVVTDARDADSTRVGAQVLAELNGRSTLGGVRQRTVRVAFQDVPTLIDECRKRKAGVVYVTPGVQAPIATLSTALEALGVLSVAAMPEHVRQGLVLGFAVRSGKPRLLVNLTQAKRQQVNFRADFLRMAEVVG